MSLMISDDGTLHASAQHLLENFMRLAAAEPPPYRPLSRDGLNEKGNLSGETTFLGDRAGPAARQGRRKC